MSASDEETVMTNARIATLIDEFDRGYSSKRLASMPEVQFEVDLQTSRRLVEIEESLAERVSVAARAKRVAPSVLIEGWIREGLANIG